MAKKINEVEIRLEMWSVVTLSAEEIEEIYPNFQSMDVDETDELEQAIQDYMDMNYLDHVMWADGALDECRVEFLYEDDGSE